MMAKEIPADNAVGDLVLDFDREQSDQGFKNMAERRFGNPSKSQAGQGDAKLGGRNEAIRIGRSPSGPSAHARCPSLPVRQYGCAGRSQAQTLRPRRIHWPVQEGPSAIRRRAL